MTKDPRIPFSFSIHKSAAEKIEKHVAKVARVNKLKRGAVLELMLLTFGEAKTNEED